MEIITRRFAIDNNLKRFFTGRPCIYGHTAERYTQSSNCVICVHPLSDNTEKLSRRQRKEEEKVQKLEIRIARRVAKYSMMRCKFRMLNCHYNIFKDMVLHLTLSREPSMLPTDIMSKWKTKHISILEQVRAFMIFREDEKTLREFERGLQILSGPSEPLPDIHARGRAEFKAQVAAENTARDSKEDWRSIAR